MWNVERRYSRTRRLPSRYVVETSSCGTKTIIRLNYLMEIWVISIGSIRKMARFKYPQRNGRLVVPPFIQVYSPFHGSIIHYDPRKKIELGYAITTHKAQGSEFDTVVYCMTRAAPRMLNRRNFYTAITRASHNVVIICDRMGMTQSMRKYNGG